jgi:hypothetical protein
MKQIQNTVPQKTQHHARATGGAPDRRPDPAPGAQIRGQKSRRASKATRRGEANAEAGRARTKKARGRVLRGGTGRSRNRFHIPYPAGEDRQSIGWWWRVTPRAPTWLPRALPALPPCPRGPGGKEGRKLAAPAAAPWGLCGTGREDGGSRGPSGFYPRRAPLLFITMAGHRQRLPPPAPASLSSRRVAFASRAPPRLA